MATPTHADGRRTVSLGEIEPARSRHMWTRSSVTLTDDAVLVGQWDGTLTAFDRRTLEATWSVTHPEPAVSVGAAGETVLVGGRGSGGTIAAYDAETGTKQWSYTAADDIGTPTNESIFYQPYVLALEEGDDRWYALARRYERDGERRQWESVLLAFETDGTVAWRYAADASPISMSLNQKTGRLAVGYNRSFGDHPGLVVLDAGDGEVEWTWDPTAGGDRRVGDVAFDESTGRLAVTSHADKRGYLLENGEPLWGVDLAVETTHNEETLYAYPNHVVAAAGVIGFITGNTYALEGRKTEGRHPNEHRLAAFDEAGDLLWDADTGGFVHGVGLDEGQLVVPSAQNFRVRDSETHGVRTFELASGEKGRHSLEGIATAAAIDCDGNTVAAIEEPIEYHDEGVLRGSYALHCLELE